MLQVLECQVCNAEMRNSLTDLGGHPPPFVRVLEFRRVQFPPPATDKTTKGKRGNNMISKEDLRAFYEREVRFNGEQIEWHRNEVAYINGELKDAREMRKSWEAEGIWHHGKSHTERKLENERAYHYRWIKKYKGWVTYYTERLNEMR